MLSTAWSRSFTNHEEQDKALDLALKTIRNQVNDTITTLVETTLPALRKKHGDAISGTLMELPALIEEDNDLATNLKVLLGKCDSDSNEDDEVAQASDVSRLSQMEKHEQMDLPSESAVLGKRIRAEQSSESERFEVVAKRARHEDAPQQTSGQPRAERRHLVDSPAIHGRW